MIQILKKKKLIRLLLSFLIAAILSSLVASVLGGAMPPPSLVSLEAGKAILTGTNGNYLGQIVIKGSIANAWIVLTDYEHYENFMPNVIESRLLNRDKNKIVFEQTQIFKLPLVEIRGQVKLAVTENSPKEITFKIIEGDVKSLEGFWKIENSSSDSILLTHKVSVEPNIKSSLNRNLFFTVYEDTLENTLVAVKEEVHKRFPSI